MGAGKWARIPWLSIIEPNQTTQSGLFIQYLVRADVSGVYLCLGQGTQKLRAAAGPSVQQTHFNTIANYVRRRCHALLGGEVSSFDLNGRVELRAPKGHGVPFEKAIVVSRFYAKGGVPEEAAVGLTASLALPPGHPGQPP